MEGREIYWWEYRRAPASSVHLIWLEIYHIYNVHPRGVQYIDFEI